MHRSCSRFALRAVTLLFLVTFGCSRALAQQQGRPEAPQAPQGPVEQNLRLISAQAPYRMISGKERIRWAAMETFGTESLLVGTLSAGIGTGRDKPVEYGPHWDGYAKRYGMRLTGIAASNTIEAGLGAIWGEDPRYVRNHLRNASEMCFCCRWPRAIVTASSCLPTLDTSRFLETIFFPTPGA